MSSSVDSSKAWEEYKPDDKNPWTMQKVAHLYRRAAFGANWSQLQEGVKLGPQKLIDRLLKGGPDLATFEDAFNSRVRSLQRLLDISQAASWWLARMLQSPHPLRERMTLFWHNHFATSFAKVQNVGYMVGQYQLMYQHALGKFSDLLQGISKDPAMLIWLDTTESKKGKPNENYARELMELFSLGIGNYSEKDIREAAKTFTGWGIQEQQYHFSAKEHDTSTKKVFGKEGNFNGEDIVQLCLNQKACPQFMIGKLYRFLVSETEAPTPELLDPLIQDFGKNFDIQNIVEKILRSNWFFSEVAYRQRIKSPVDFILGLVRALEAKVGTTQLARSLESLGQSLFQPPSVKGWDGGPTWLNGQTLLFRHNLSLTMCQTRQKTEDGSQPLPVLIAKQHAKPGLTEALEFFLNLFIQNDLPADTKLRLMQYVIEQSKQDYPAHWSESRRQEHAMISLSHVILTLPEYQLN